MKLLLLFAFCVVSVALVHAFDSTDDNQRKSAKNVPSDRGIKSTGERSSGQIRKSESGHGVNVRNRVPKKLHDKTQRMSNSNKLKKASRDGKIVKHKKKASRDGKIVKHKKASRDGKIVKHKKKASQDRKFVKKMDHQSKKSCAGVCVEDAQECTHGTIVKSKCHDGLKCCVSDEPRVKTEEKRKVCRANKKCTKKNGSCQPKKICSGSIVKGKLCTGGCVCCASVDSSCKTKKSCKAVNGACGPLSQSCSGQLHKGKQYCKGSGCGCCSPTGTTTSPATVTTLPVESTTPVQNTTLSSQPTTSVGTSTNSTTPTTSTSTNCSISRLYCAGCGQNNIVVPTSRIVNGSDASPGEFPYQVYLTPTIAGLDYTCGGSIIKKRWILTAAHCFFDKNGVKASGVSVGVGSISSNNITQVSTSRFITHQNYNSTTNANDIALVELAADLPFDTNPNVQPICLGQESDIPYGGRVVATGWGRLASGQATLPTTLQEVQLDVITSGVCSGLASLPPNPAQVLCTLTLYKDTCQGDSGGPLVAQVCPGRWVQVGVVSYGFGCAVPNNPGVNTRVSAYADWITQNTGSATC